MRVEREQRYKYRCCRLKKQSVVGGLAAIVVAHVVVLAIVKVVLGIVVVDLVFVVAQIVGFGGSIADIVFRLWM